MTDGTVTAVGIAKGVHYITIRASAGMYLTYLHVNGDLTAGSSVSAGSSLGVMMHDPGITGPHVHVFGTDNGVFTEATASSRRDLTDQLKAA